MNENESGAYVTSEVDQPKPATTASDADQGRAMPTPDNDVNLTDQRLAALGIPLGAERIEVTDPCPECFPWRPDARVRYRCERHTP